MLSKLTVLVIILLTYGYLLYPKLTFPKPPPDSSQSAEDADSESFYRRAYFTNYSREEVVAHYESQFNYLPILKLNYPPEDAQTLIRDQARSSYLEELVHPLRESIYINGFSPKTAKDEIWHRGIKYKHKITIKYVPGNVIPAFLVVTAAGMLAYWLIKEIEITLKE